MKVRSRLILAFLAISVVPLSAVTLYSYYSSRDALQRAAEQQARTMAAELGHRMEWVTRDLEQRMDQIWSMPGREQFVHWGGKPSPPAGPGRPAAPPPTAAAAPTSGVSGELAGELAGVLGEVAPMLDALEIETTQARGGPRAAPPAPPVPPAGAGGTAEAVPAPPVPPPAGETPGGVRVFVKDLEPGPGAPGGGTEPRGPRKPVFAVDSSGRVVVEMSQLMGLALQKYRQETAGEGAPTPEQIAAWAKALQDRMQRGASEIERATREREQQRREAAARARQHAEAAAPRPQVLPVKTTTVFKGRDVSFLMQQDGREVGRVKARLNLKRLLSTVLANSRRDQGEIAFAVDPEGRLHGPDGPDRAVVAALQPAAAVSEDTTNVRTVNDWVVVTRKDRTGVTFGIARPIADDLRDLRGVAARNFGLGFGLIALVFVGSAPLASRMTRHLKTLMAGVQQIARGDLSARVPVRSRDEFGQLAGAFNQMAQDLATHQQMLVERERLHRELELCRQIQLGILPREPLRLGVAEVKGLSIPAREVGGDFFNYFLLPDGNIAVLVGDVSGKGVGAALLMANIQATLRARLPLEQDLAALADALDHELEATTPPEMFLTLFVGIVDTRAGTLRYVNAGHNTQFVLRREQGLERMATTGMPLGLFAGHGYHEGSVHLDEGDLLFFYTDGMVETENEAGEVWGVEHLEPLLLQGPNAGVDAVLARVEGEVRRFRGNAEPLDDATLMVLRFGKHS